MKIGHRLLEGTGLLEVVSATRLPEVDFWRDTPLGLSLKRFEFDERLWWTIFFENDRGLPGLFNSRIESDRGEEYLAFVHDDVWLNDLFFADQVVEGCASFDVVGVAGSVDRVPEQPSWLFRDLEFRDSDKARGSLSGSIAHGEGSFGGVSYYGPSKVECELLDGVFLAAKKETLVERSVRFDPRFDFHFYDMDFCRTSRERGLRLGTWPISLAHSSVGNFNTPRWFEGCRGYKDKWEAGALASSGRGGK